MQPFWKQCLTGLIATILPTVSATSVSTDPDVDFRVSIYSSRVIEGAPILVTLSLINRGGSDVFLPFSDEEAHLVGVHSTLLLSDEQGRIRSIQHEREGAPPVSCGVARFYPLKPGDKVTGDSVMGLVCRTRDEKHRYSWEIVGPGHYTGCFQLNAGGGVLLTSNKFQITVTRAEGPDAEARAQIGLSHITFFEGRIRPPDPSCYHGGKWWKKVDVSRYGEIQKILDDYPDSEYAEWIRFWKLYHHGPVDDAIEYAREHRDFPLSDNLMLHVAQRLFNQAGKYDRAAYDRVRKLVAELLRDFPTGDTRSRALDLQQKLTRKP